MPTDPIPAILDELVHGSRTVPPERFHELIAATGRHVGATEVEAYLQDYAQALLMPMGGGEPLAVDGTIGGRAFTTGEVVTAQDEGGTRLWLPLVDGAERLGVLRARVSDPDEGRQRDYVRWANLVTSEVVARGQYTDHFALVRRTRPMALAAEMQWQLLPPVAFVTEEVAVAGIVEPAYDVGGDAFDYAQNRGSLHLAVFDAMGHGVQSSLTAGVAVSAYRHGRRSGHDLVGIYAEIDAVVAEHRPIGFATALLARLDAGTGTLYWINAGHPPPKLLRDARVHDLPALDPCLPLGLGSAVGREVPVAAAEVNLQPGDRVLFYTDGAVDAVGLDGEPFGEERLTDFLLRQAAAGLDLAETLRRLVRAILEHTEHTLRDDATIVLLEHRRRLDPDEVPLPGEGDGEGDGDGEPGDAGAGGSDGGRRG